jgi:hypothetical protein
MITRYRDFNIDASSAWGYVYSHVEYDGPEDRRIGSARTLEQAKAEVDDWHTDNPAEEEQLQAEEGNPSRP